MISLEVLGREALPLEGMYRRARQDILPSRESPGSRNLRRNGSNVGNASSIGSFDDTPRNEMHPLDQPAVELGLPPHIPEILYCKWQTSVLLGQVRVRVNTRLWRVRVREQGLKDEEAK